NLARSSFYKKLVGYWESWSQNLFSQNFGFKKVRVLTLTISEERVKSILRAGKELDPRKKGSKMFLMAPDKSFDISRPETILGPSWVNGCGETVPLID
ncbi:hypothetical protein, partial [Desulfatibacillum aliphaticivorans]|uniref:hypothetical protein n=1 Tax=Desulfatibacillum aliphaticivorans TaxID=218208 RepID=UPI00054DB644